MLITLRHSAMFRASVSSIYCGPQRIVPRPGQFHQGHAGVMDLSDGEERSILHRTTAVYGHAGIAWSQDQGKESATEIPLAAVDETGRTR